MLFSLLFTVALLASELRIHPSGMRDRQLERATCPSGGVELLASELHIHPSGVRDRRLEGTTCPNGGVDTTKIDYLDVFGEHFRDF